MGPLFISDQEQQRRQRLLQQNQNGVEQTGGDESSAENIQKLTKNGTRTKMESPDCSSHGEDSQPPPLSSHSKKTGSSSQTDKPENGQKRPTNKYHHHHHYYNHYRSYSTSTTTTTTKPGRVVDGFINPNNKMNEGPQNRHHTTATARPSSIIGNLTKTSSTSTSNLRRYIVLLQDCLAIKFVPVNGIGDQHYYHHHQDQQGFPFDLGSGSTHRLIVGSGVIPQQTHVSPTFPNQTPSQQQTTTNLAQSVSAASSGTAANASLGNGSLNAMSNSGNNNATEVDEQQTVQHGFHLYKAFKEANLKCYWNTTMCESMRRIEYKGFLVPSTILVYSSCPRYLNVLRTAWSRRILRHPPGYRIDMLGDIEEVVAQPVQQGQFAPLSDSLCWAILELTSSGQEAFVDSIMKALTAAFPSMSQPPKELVFQTLEKLIRDQKIYQTSHGYYIVTPDVSTFMSSRSATPAPASTQTCFIHNGMRPRSLALMDGVFSNFSNDLDKISWGSAASIQDGEELLRRSNYFYCNGNEKQQQPVLKRHNSMRIIRNSKETDYVPRPHMGARSLSFRLSKGNSLFDSDREDYYCDDNEARGIETNSGKNRNCGDSLNSTNGNISPQYASTGENSNAGGTTKKRPFFLRRWFSFRRLKAKTPNHSTHQSNTSTLVNAPAKTTSSTQTIRSISSRSIENVRVDDNRQAHSQSHLRNSTLVKSKWNSLPNTRQQLRKSLLHEESPFYDELVRSNGRHPSGRVSSLGFCNSDGERVRVMDRVANRDDPRMYHQNVSSRRSRHLSGSGNTMRTASPCPSSVVSAIYASIANNNLGTKLRDCSPGCPGGERSRMGHVTRNIGTMIHPCQAPAGVPGTVNPTCARQFSPRKQKQAQAARPRSAYEILYSTQAQVQVQQQNMEAVNLLRDSPFPKCDNLSTISAADNTPALISNTTAEVECSRPKIHSIMPSEGAFVKQTGSSCSEQDDETVANIVTRVDNLLVNTSCSDDADSNRESSDVSH